MQATRISINRLFLAFGLYILCLTSDAESKDAERPEVTIVQGTLRGKTLETRHGRNISAFIGIPYAEPPTGNLRFANPVAAHGWNGTRDASRDANICPQVISAVSGDEDCLYLNVYTPKLAHTSSSPLLAVMVYIHGGAFMYENSRSSNRGPGHILDKDVILVTLNYRLGALGFLSTGDEVASGNWGLKDQVLALKWVQDNIEYFGGDPNRVTIFGESAGGACVHFLTLSNSTIGLFHRFITQSGSALATWAYQPRAEKADRAFELGKSVGCSRNTTKSLINCLRTLNSSDIVTAQSNANSMDRVVYWTPTDEPDIKGALLTDSPKNLIATGQMQDLPWISGVDRDDGLLVTGDLYANPELFDETLEKFDSTLPILLGYTNPSNTRIAQINAIKSYYCNDLTANKSLVSTENNANQIFSDNVNTFLYQQLLANLTALFGDFTFYYPAYNALRQRVETAKSPRYLYTFNYRGTYSLTYLYTGSTMNYGVAHADELIFLFPLQDVYFSNLNETMNKTDHKMVDMVVTLWTSFAMNGTPTLSPLNYNATWDPFSTMDNYIQIGDESEVTVKARQPFFRQRMQFWADLYAATETRTT